MRLHLVYDAIEQEIIKHVALSRRGLVVGLIAHSSRHTRRSEAMGHGDEAAARG